MSRLTDLLQNVSKLDPSLGTELSREFQTIMSSQNYGLVFEKHQPEAVELPSIKPTRGSTVRIMSPSGQNNLSEPDNRLWKVTAVSSALDGNKSLRYTVVETGVPEDRSEVIKNISGDRLVVVSEFQDTIYPGLIETGSVFCAENPDKPAHVVLNAENYHALQLLTYTHRHSIDAIYIDPPYNTGAKDWKYNNDYVGTDDMYRHSKWLSFMERRLKIAKELLNPADSVLIVTIDEKEYLRLGLLLEQVFPGEKIQMVSSVINPKGTARANEFSRIDEFIFFVMIGDYKLTRTGQDMMSSKDVSEDEKVRWRGFPRTGRKGLRPVNPGSWYPIYFNTVDDKFHSIGDTVLEGEPVPSPPIGTYAIWPPVRNGEEYSWAMIPETFLKLLDIGAIRFGKPRKGQGCSISYLTNNQLKQIENGIIEVRGHDENGSMEVAFSGGAKTTAPKTQWNLTSHEAGAHGTNLISALLPGRRFPFPKSLYAVEDALRFFVKDKPNATILDFFAGSGTTAHAVMRLNKQDGGNRRSISVTNNEVSAEEQNKLRKFGLRPGDPDWEKLGICDFITKPRISSSITGKTPDGEPIEGYYAYTDEFPISDGLAENARFFSLTYLSPNIVTAGRAFQAVAPMLWLAAGQKGRVIDHLGDPGWDATDFYGVAENMDSLREFVDAVNAKPECHTVFIITDDDGAFELAAQAVRDDMKTYRLYESYLNNFEIVNR